MISRLMNTAGCLVLGLLAGTPANAERVNCWWNDFGFDFKPDTAAEVRACVSQGADPNAKDDQGKTPAQLADDNERFFKPLD